MARCWVRFIDRVCEAIGVERVAPSHCTGDVAMRLFREAWGESFVEGGAGAVIEVAPSFSVRRSRGDA